jgi:hypothetical protein
MRSEPAALRRPTPGRRRSVSRQQPPGSDR